MIGFENFNYVQAVILAIALFTAFKVGEVRADLRNIKFVIDKINNFYKTKRKHVTAKELIAHIFPGITKND